MPGPDRLSLDQWRQVARAVVGLPASRVFRLSDLGDWHDALEQAAQARGAAAVLDGLSQDGGPR
ncbi:hypothetical protein [Actinokineospora sp.]|uniref:hypothetical protein n=1 Tax=Actinokineospora sp. TaxID=1872133 RepID=UPI0040378402